jgi:hypothetical protein
LTLRHVQPGRQPNNRWMKKNLTPLLQSAIAHGGDWQFAQFYMLLETLETNAPDITVSYWEGEENWASIHRADQRLGLIWKKYPFVVLHGEIEAQLAHLLIPFGTIHFLPVNSIQDDLFHLDDDREGRLSELPNGDAFTIENLWFYTNSI